MESNRIDLRGDPAVIRSTVVHSAQNKKDRFEKHEKDSIYLSVHGVGVNLMTATGGAEITHDNLLALQFRGYLDHSPDDILESCYEDLNDLNADVRFGYEEQTAEQAVRDAQLADEIARANLPTELFKQVDFVAKKGISTGRSLKNGEVSLDKDVGIVSDQEAGYAERLSRYAKYILAKKLLGEVRDDISERRLIGIALGIFIEDKNDERPNDNAIPKSAKKISSYQSELRKASNYAIDLADIEMAAEAVGWYELIYPERYKSYLERLRQTVNEPIVVQLKDKNDLYDVSTSELWIDVRFKRLLLGETTVKALVGDGLKPENVHKLGELLVADSVDYRFYKHDANRYRSWTREDFIKYGQWLQKLISNHDADLDKKVISNGAQLGIGPGEKPIGRVFGYHHNFFMAVGSKLKSHQYMFEEWTFDDFVNHIKMVSLETGQRPTKELLISRAKNGLIEPSPSTILRRAGGLTAVLEAAGFPPRHKEWTREEILKSGVVFVSEHGRFPRQRDLRHKLRMPTYRSVAKNFSSMQEFYNDLADEISVVEVRQAA